MNELGISELEKILQERLKLGVRDYANRKADEMANELKEEVHKRLTGIAAELSLELTQWISMYQDKHTLRIEIKLPSPKEQDER